MGGPSSGTWGYRRKESEKNPKAKEFSALIFKSGKKLLLTLSVTRHPKKSKVWAPMGGGAFGKKLITGDGNQCLFR